MTDSIGELTSYKALDNTNLIADAQWRALGRMSLRSGKTIEQLLDGFHIEPVDTDKSDNIRLLGTIWCGPGYQLYGCIDTDGSINT